METMKQIPPREKIPAEDKWALEDLYPTVDVGNECAFVGISAFCKVFAGAKQPLEEKTRFD